MKVTDILVQARRPLFTFELLPPLKGHTMDSINEAVETLLPFNPSYINITSHQQEIVYLDRPDGLVERKIVHRRPGTVSLAAAIQYRYGVPVVPHIICGGQSKDQIEDQLVDLGFLGIDNVFALRGDPMHGQRRFEAPEGGYEHTDALVRQIANLNQGRYLDPTIKDPVPGSFCVGVAGYPEKHAEAPNLEHDIAMLKQKVDAGANYIVTQMFFINDHYFKFVQMCRDAGILVPIIPGVKPLGRKSDIDLLPQTFHVDLPESLVVAVAACTNAAQVRQAGIAYCKEQVAELLEHGVPGVHFYTLGKAESIAAIVRDVFPS